MIELIIFGILTGFFSGFFGVGGGMVLVPMLLFVHYSMKHAVSISIVQMVFTSFYGSFLNSKTNKHISKDGLVLGLGGFLGGLGSGVIVSNTSNEFLQYLFLTIVVLGAYKVYTTQTVQIRQQKIKSKKTLFLIGIIVGLLAMSIGVGGSVMLIPILAGILYYDLKTASSLGLFFVMFSSVAGFVSLSIAGHMLYKEGLIVGIAALIGVYIGITLKNKIQITSYKHLTFALYVIICISVVFKLLTTSN